LPIDAAELKHLFSDEALQFDERLVVGQLARRVLAEGRRSCVDRTAEAAVPGDAGATDEIDGDARAVG
jgi:hypothetical protein